MARTWLFYTILCHFLGKGSLLGQCSVVEGVVGYYCGAVRLLHQTVGLFFVPSSTVVVTVCFLISLMLPVKIVLISSALPFMPAILLSSLHRRRGVIEQHMVWSSTRLQCEHGIGEYHS